MASDDALEGGRQAGAPQPDDKRLPDAAAQQAGRGGRARRRGLSRADQPQRTVGQRPRVGGGAIKETGRGGGSKTRPDDVQEVLSKIGK